jgi:DNA-binding transcriptional ArsR family regulator
MDQSPFSELASADRLIHDPSRLAILSALLACAEADFQYLLAATGLSKGNLSSHLSKLETGGLVAIRKGFEGKIPWTRAALTVDGRDKVEAHWQNLERLRSRARKWR